MGKTTGGEGGGEQSAIVVTRGQERGKLGHDSYAESYPTRLVLSRLVSIETMKPQ